MAQKLQALQGNPAGRAVVMTAEPNMIDGKIQDALPLAGVSKFDNYSDQVKLQFLKEDTEKVSEAGSDLAEAPDIAPQNQRAEIVTVLGRHENLLKGKIDDKKLDKMIKDEDLPTDLRDALQQLKENPDLRNELDAAGDKNGKSDGIFSIKDIRVMQNDSEIKEYADKKSESYLGNYVPSDAAP